MDVCWFGFPPDTYGTRPAGTTYEQSHVVSHVLFFFCYPDMSNQLRAVKLRTVRDFGHVRTSGRKGYIVFNGRYSAVCTAKRIENWNHGKGDCFRVCSLAGCKRGMSSSSSSSSLTPGSVVMWREGRFVEQAQCPCTPIKGQLR